MIDLIGRATLLRILPYVPAHRVDEYLVLNNEAMGNAQVNTPRRMAMWLAQCGHESGHFRYLEEIADGSRYEGRKDLGNTEPGDGKRFKGRGIIQLTGRDNYRAYGAARGMDFVRHPELVAAPGYAFDVAAFFWSRARLNPMADIGDLRGVTKRINGGLNGLQQRQEIYARALGVLGT